MPNELNSDLADELIENGLDDVAEYLLANGVEATREWIDGAISESRANDDPEGWRLHNLEVARDRLGDAAQ
jgi:hypothetical protein